MELEAFIYRGWHIGRLVEDGRRFWATRNPYEQWSLRQEFCSKEDAMRYADDYMDERAKKNPGADEDGYDATIFGLR